MRSSTNGLAATGPQSGSNFLKTFSETNFFCLHYNQKKYAESIAEISFQIRSQSPEIFAFLWPPGLLNRIRRNAASTITRVADTLHWATPCAAISS